MMKDKQWAQVNAQENKTSRKTLILGIIVGLLMLAVGVYLVETAVLMTAP